MLTAETAIFFSFAAFTRLLYLDAPISGGSKKSLEGKLSYMISGNQKAQQKAKPLLDATSEKVFEFGKSVGAGSAMKSVNQMLAGIHISAMAEAITFGITQGIEPKKFLEVVSECAGTSWMLENRAPHIIDDDYSLNFQYTPIGKVISDLNLLKTIKHGENSSYVLRPDKINDAYIVN